jgi:hypothetical protein
MPAVLESTTCLNLVANLRRHVRRLPNHSPDAQLDMDEIMNSIKAIESAIVRLEFGGGRDE